MGENLFIIMCALVIASGFWVVFSPSLIHSAVSLMFTLFGTAGLYVFLYADFIAATQVLIYVGGILVLIIFGVMLTNRIEKSSIASSSKNQFIGGMCSLAIFVMLVSVIFNTSWHVGKEYISEDSVSMIGKMLLTEYLLPFEIASILLLAALMGAALLSRKI
jgi:NADH-quinone oxidoreductase subunit J